MQKIRTFLWFDTQAEEAARFYTSIFPSSKLLDVNPMTATFELDGQEFIALNGGPRFKFTEAISLFVTCQSQAEVDRYWAALTANGGEESMCGWLKDRYGLSWQIIPSVLMDLIGDADPEKSQRAMQAMLQMHKIDIQALQAAHAGAVPSSAD